MPRRFFASQPRHSSQKGSALIVGLIIVLMLTLLGITTLRATALEERMAGNQRDVNISFQSAEGALREVINKDLSSVAFDGSTTGYGEQISSFLDSSGNPVSEYNYWTGVFDWTNKAVAATQATGTSEAARYFVETIPVSSGVWKAGEATKRIYRITVRGTGASTRAQTIVQGTIIQEN